MKFLALPELTNMESMKRKDIITVVSSLTLNEVLSARLQVVLDKGRNVKQLMNLLRKMDSLLKYTDMQTPNGHRIGDEVGYVETNSCRGGWSMSQKYGRIVAISGTSALVWDRGDTHLVDLRSEDGVL